MSSDKEHSGFEIKYDGEYRAITDVINVYNLANDDARANLLRAIREAVLEAKRAKQKAEKYVQRAAAQHG